MVPTLVEEFERDREAGWRAASAIFNLIVVTLVAVTLIGIAFAPQLFSLLTLGTTVPQAERMRQAGGVLLALMVPQVLFYGVDLVTTGVLNAHRRFSTPVLFVIAGNGVAVAALLAYAARGGDASLRLDRWDYVLLGGGATAGVAVIAIIGLGALYPLRPRYSLGLGRGIDAVRRASRAAGWMFVYVLANQVGLVVVLVLANRVVGGVAAYQYAYMLFMLPYTVIGLSLATTMLPEATSLAVTGDRGGVARLLSYRVTQAVAVLAPVSLVLVIAARPVVDLLYGYGVVGAGDVDFVASVAAAFGAGLLPFTAFQILARGHYAFRDMRTPALVNVGAVVVNIVLDIALFNLLNGRARVVGLALGHAASYSVAAAGLWLLASRRLTGNSIRLDIAALRSLPDRRPFSRRET